MSWNHGPKSGPTLTLACGLSAKATRDTVQVHGPENIEWGQRTRTANFHVAKVDPADFGGLLRPIAAGQNVIHTLANYPAQRRPRDRRAMESVSDLPHLRVTTGSRVASRRWRTTRGMAAAWGSTSARHSSDASTLSQQSGSLVGSCEYARNPPALDSTGVARPRVDDNGRLPAVDHHPGYVHAHGSARRGRTRRAAGTPPKERIPQTG